MVRAVDSTVVCKWGNGTGVRISKAVREEAGFALGDQLQVTVHKGRIELTEAQEPLMALLSQITPDNRHEEQIADQKGNEIL